MPHWLYTLTVGTQIRRSRHPTNEAGRPILESTEQQKKMQPRFLCVPTVWRSSALSRCPTARTRRSAFFIYGWCLASERQKRCGRWHRSLAASSLPRTRHLDELWTPSCRQKLPPVTQKVARIERFFFWGGGWVGNDVGGPI